MHSGERIAFCESHTLWQETGCWRNWCLWCMLIVQTCQICTSVFETKWSLQDWFHVSLHWFLLCKLAAALCVKSACCVLCVLVYPNARVCL